MGWREEEEKNSMGTVRKLLIVRTLSGWPTRGYSSNPTPAAHSAPTRTIHPQRSARRLSAGFATAKPGSQRSFWAKAHLDLHRSHHAGGSFGGMSTHLLDPLRHGPLHLVRSQRVDDDGHDLEGNLSQKENPAVVLQYQSITLFYAIHAQPYLRLEVQ